MLVEAQQKPNNATSQDISNELSLSDPPITSLSLVIPLLNEEESLHDLHREISNALHEINMPAEIIYIDDGSSDASAQVLQELYQNDPRVEIIQFRRNFGKSAALSAGFDEATGDAVITMDADLQDVPAEIPRLLEALENGYDLVSGWKYPRLDPLGKRLPSAIFNRVVRTLTGVRLHDFNCGFKAYRFSVIGEIDLYGELHRYIPVLAHNRGFKIAEVKVQHRSRIHGYSKFGSTRFFRGFFDLITVLFLTQYTRRPLHFFGWFGTGSLLSGFLINSYLATVWFMGEPIGHRPLLLLGVLLMMLGAQFVIFGLLAEMIAASSTGRREFTIRRHLRKTAWRDNSTQVEIDG